MNSILFLLAASLFVPQGEGTKPKQDPKKGSVAQKRRPVPMPIPKAIVKYRGETKIRIDGALDEWPPTMPLILRDTRQVSGTALGAYHGLSDISGQLYMLWDEQYLYLALQVLDDWHHGLKKNVKLRHEIPPVDNAMITFDPKRDTRGYGDDPGRREDRTFYFAQLEEVGDKLIVWNRLKGAGKELAKGANCVVDRRKKEGVTIYEARIPWREILPPGQKAKDRRVFDMQVILNDYDAYIDHLPQTRVGWNFGMGLQIKPGLFGSVMLLKKYEVGGAMPRFPPPPMTKDHRPGRRYWVDTYAKITATKPTFCTVDTPDPAMAGGEVRFKLLSDLDGHLRAFPRLANIEYHHRIQRRMTREAAGIAQNGLPFYWDYAMRDVIRRAVPPPGKDVIRVFRLPQGGWYVRTNTVNFAIDPCGLGFERLYLMGGIDFVLLTRPTEITRRHDPLLIRMSASKPKRPFFTHMEFHLPGAKVGSMFKVKPFKDYGMGGLKRIMPIALMTKDGKITVSVGYLVEWNNGQTLVHAGQSITQTLIKKLGVAPDVLIISGAYGKELAKLARDFGAKATLIDDALIAEEYPAHFGGRLTYRQALKHQNELKPLRTLILAPGESIDFKK
jgi:hypothetical protein